MTCGRSATDTLPNKRFNHDAAARRGLCAGRRWVDGRFTDLRRRSRRLRRWLWLFAGLMVVSLLLAGCGSAARAQLAPSPSLTHTRHFASPALGVAFSFPASWRVQPSQPGIRSGDGVLISGASGSVGVIVYYSARYADRKARRPGPFGPADAADLKRLSADAPGKPMRAQLAPLDGLRMATVEWVADMPAAGGGSEASHAIWYGSTAPSATQSYVRIAVWCPTTSWSSDKAGLVQLLRSVCFSKPKGS